MISLGVCIQPIAREVRSVRLSAPPAFLTTAFAFDPSHFPCTRRTRRRHHAQASFRNNPHAGRHAPQRPSGRNLIEAATVASQRGEDPQPIENPGFCAQHKLRTRYRTVGALAPWERTAEQGARRDAAARGRLVPVVLPEHTDPYATKHLPFRLGGAEQDRGSRVPSHHVFPKRRRGDPKGRTVGRVREHVREVLCPRGTPAADVAVKDQPSLQHNLRGSSEDRAVETWIAIGAAEAAGGEREGDAVLGLGCGLGEHGRRDAEHRGETSDEERDVV